MIRAINWLPNGTKDEVAVAGTNTTSADLAVGQPLRPGAKWRDIVSVNYFADLVVHKTPVFKMCSRSTQYVEGSLTARRTSPDLP